MKGNRNTYIYIGLFLTICIFTWIGSIHTDKLSKQRYIRFDTSNINAKISYLGYRNHGIGLKVRGSDEVFVFYPYDNPEINTDKTFLGTAKVGDSVSKKSLSDTLYLFPDGNKYKYNFRME